MTGHPAYKVGQGPEAVVDLFVNPPWWGQPLIMAAFVLIAGLVVAAVIRNGGVPDDAIVEMIEIGVTILAIAGATKFSVALFGLAYYQDVAMGFVAGAAVAHLILVLADVEQLVKTAKAVRRDAIETDTSE